MGRENKIKKKRKKKRKQKTGQGSKEGGGAKTLLGLKSHFFFRLSQKPLRTIFGDKKGKTQRRLQLN